MAASKPFYKIDHLNHENYNAWAYKMQMVLEHENLWQVVEMDPPESLSEDQQMEWSMKSAAAKRAIVLHCENNQIVYIKRCISGRQAWFVLRDIHQQSTVSARIRTMKQLFHIRMGENDMRTHLDNLIIVMDKLGEMDVSFGNSVLVAIILASLGPEYDNIVTAIEGWDEKRLTISAVQSKLIEEYGKMKNDKALRVDVFTCYQCG
jgi:gag-polypeptide of LTR copia-type